MDSSRLATLEVEIGDKPAINSTQSGLLTLYNKGAILGIGEGWPISFVAMGILEIRTTVPHFASLRGQLNELHGHGVIVGIGS